MSNKFNGNVRVARSDDLVAIKSIIDEWQNDSASIVASIQDSAAGLKDWKYWVALAPSGRVVGVMGLATSNIDSDLATPTQRVAELVSAYVAHDARGTGVGTALAETVETEAVELGFGRLLIVSGSRNRESGYPFWRRRYGEPLRVDDNYFGPGAERVVWAKDFLTRK